LDLKETDLLEMANKCEMIIANSEYTSKQLVAAGLSRTRVKTVYIDGAISNRTGQQESRDHDSLRILAAGRLQRHKGFHNLLLAVSKASRNGVNVEAVIAGEGPYRRNLSHVAADLRILDRIRFVGKVNSHQITSLYEWSDVVIMPTITPEPFGRVAVEAMSRGKPVIASRIGGIPEIVEHGQTGLLVQPDDPEDLTEKIMLLETGVDTRRRMGTMALQVCRTKFDSGRITKQLLELYQGLA
jgi:glycosyltransferase involved in cell wall biosynthesis